MGADAFIRARRARAGRDRGRIRKRDMRPVVELTAQEAGSRGWSRDGRSNPEIAAELFISPRTVEYHLRKVFSKLDITGRGQLARALAAR